VGTFDYRFLVHGRITLGEGNVALRQVVAGLSEKGDKGSY
jgi:hypothetical protein